MKVVRALGNGSCLFISLRLALEYYHIIKAKKDNASFECITVPEEECKVQSVITGSDPKIVKSAEDLRQLIVRWYETKLGQEMPDLGTYVERGRIMTRGDLIALEMASAHGEEIPDAIDSSVRQAAMRTYLERIRRGSWGSTPEYTAFAFMSCSLVEVYQVTNGVLKIINSVGPKTYKQTVKVLYSGRCHYDLLMDNEDFTILHS